VVKLSQHPMSSGRKVVASLWGSYAKPLSFHWEAAGRDVRHFE
jgi:hypothetical protein